MALMLSLDGFQGAAKSAEEAIEQCVLANRILANEEILDGFGHVGVRNPDNQGTFFQSRSLSPEQVTKEDILEIDLKLKARPDVNAVFHGHPHSVIPFSSTGIPIRPIAHFGSMFYDGIPLYDDYDVNSGMLIATPEEGERVARTLENARAVLLRDHGACVVGDSVPTMVMASIFLRDNAKLQYQAIQLGDPKYLSDEEARQATKIMESDIAVQRAWSYWVSRAKKAMPDLL
jgi:ribulose-5-phosphate 4-epimerase/fuculose-1-phosphate aldolase